MWLDNNKSYLVFGKQLNNIIIVLQMMSDKYPDIENLYTIIERYEVL